VTTNIDTLKRQARRMTKQPGNTLTHSQCLELLSRQAGFKSYAALRAATPREELKK